MSSTFSPNRAYNLQATGDNNGTWGVVANSDFSIIDLNFGGRLSIDCSGNSDITVSTTQARNVYHILTGVLTGNINYKLPAEGMIYTLNNQTTGAFTVTAICTGGTGIVIPQGTIVPVFVNPDTPALGATVNYLPSLSTVFNGLHGADIASATTTNLSTATGNYVHVTGTTAITAITLGDGYSRTVEFTSILTLTNGSNLVLPGGANITTAAGDIAIFQGDASSVVRCTSYIRNGTGSTAPLLSGTSANNLVQLDGSAKLPAVDGSQLTNITASQISGFINLIYPVGSYYFNETVSTNPNTLFGVGTWVAVQDRFPIGAGNTYSAGSTGGATTHTLTAGEIPTITGVLVSTQGTGIYNADDATGSIVSGASLSVPGNNTKATIVTSSTNTGGSAHSILNPYIGVYIWKRTA